MPNKKTPKIRWSNVAGDTKALQKAIDKANKALRGDSNDAEHDALLELIEVTKLELRVSTPNGYDRRWIDAINTILSDRETGIEITDINDTLWDEFIGPMCDTIEAHPDVELVEYKKSADADEPPCENCNGYGDGMIGDPDLGQEERSQVCAVCEGTGLAKIG